MQISMDEGSKKGIHTVKLLFRCGYYSMAATNSDFTAYNNA